MAFGFYVCMVTCHLAFIKVSNVCIHPECNHALNMKLGLGGLLNSTSEDRVVTPGQDLSYDSTFLGIMTPGNFKNWQTCTNTVSFIGVNISLF